MSYHQITSAERYMLSAFRKQGCSQAQIARHLGRHRSTISRELKRNSSRLGFYRPSKAIEQASGRRSRSRRNQRFTRADLAQVEALLCQQWSPEQIAGYLRKQGRLSISHETIYRHVWHDHRRGGLLYRQLRCALKQRRKRYRSYDSRGRLAGKRHISERPAAVQNRRTIGHWEIDTVLGKGSKHCIVSLVERKTGFLLIGKLKARTKEETARRTIELIRKHARHVQTITADNGTEFHCYKQIEQATGVKFYFATPHHSWERGTNENTNGLIRQYLPKNLSMASVSQAHCTAIAQRINGRPRKRHHFKSPGECFHAN